MAENPFDRVQCLGRIVAGWHWHCEMRRDEWPWQSTVGDGNVSAVRIWSALTESFCATVWNPASLGLVRVMATGPFSSRLEAKFAAVSSLARGSRASSSRF